MSKNSLTLEELIKKHGGELPEVTPNTLKQKLRIIVRGVYGIQKLRVQLGNRIIASIYAKLGIAPGKKPKKVAEEFLKFIRMEFERITDAIVEEEGSGTQKNSDSITTILGKENRGLISDRVELGLTSNYLDLLKMEKDTFKEIEVILNENISDPDFCIWEWLKSSDVSGCGPAMAAVIISEYDINKSIYVSKMWSYAGLDVARDGRGRGRYENHLVERDYINKKGEPDTKKGISFNPFLKTKLMGVLGPQFLRQQRHNDHYAKIFYDYRNRLEQRQDTKDVIKIVKGKSKIEEDKKNLRKNRAMRYMVKMFIKDLYVEWRTRANLPVELPYEQAKLGHQPHTVI